MASRSAFELLFLLRRYASLLVMMDSRRRESTPTKGLTRSHKPAGLGRLSDSSVTNGSFVENGSELQSCSVIMEKQDQSSDNALTADELFMVYQHIKFLEEQQSASLSLIQSLRAELDVAYSRVQELEFEHRLSRKEMDHLLKKYSEDKNAWRCREQERINEIIYAVNDEVEIERRAKKKIDSLNRKLGKELDDLRRERKQLLQELQEERKARQVLEEVCDELAKEIGEDKAKAEELIRESVRYREEVEEERRMLHTAEILREERIQMKLEAARLFMEEKSMALEKLKAELEIFLDSVQYYRAKADVSNCVHQAELLRDAVNFLRIQEMPEIPSHPTTSEEMFSVEEDLHSIDIRSNCVTKKQTCDSSFKEPESQISSVRDYFMDSQNFSHNNDEEDWDSSSQPSSEEEATKNPQEDFEDEEDEANNFHALNRGSSVNITDDAASDNGSIVEEETSKNVRKPEGHMKKEDPLIAFPRKASPEKREFCKTVSTKCRTHSPMKSFHSPHRSPLRGPQEGCNPHISRGIQGFIEWPKGIRHNSLQARLLEAKIETQKHHRLPPGHQSQMKGRTRTVNST